MEYAADRIQGTRDYQQDEFGFIDGDDLVVDGAPLKVFVVADGMGGHKSGEQASEAAVVSYVHNFAASKGPVTDRLRDTLDRANLALHEKINQEPQLKGMGTTLLAAAITSTTLQWISVGDSKLRIYKAATRVVQHINADHSMAPVIDALEQAERSASGFDRHALRSALLGEDIPMVDLSSQPQRLESGDIVLLASDGLDVLDEGEIGDILQAHSHQGASQVVATLLQAVEAKGHSEQDNTTALVVFPNHSGSTVVTPAVAPTKSTERLRKWLFGGAVVLSLALAALFWSIQKDSSPTIDTQPDTQPDIQPVDTLEEEHEIERETNPVPDKEKQPPPIQAEQDAEIGQSSDQDSVDTTND